MPFSFGHTREAQADRKLGILVGGRTNLLDWSDHASIPKNPRGHRRLGPLSESCTDRGQTGKAERRSAHDLLRRSLLPALNVREGPPLVVPPHNSVGERGRSPCQTVATKSRQSNKTDRHSSRVEIPGRSLPRCGDSAIRGQAQAWPNRLGPSWTSPLASRAPWQHYARGACPLAWGGTRSALATFPLWRILRAIGTGCIR